MDLLDKYYEKVTLGGRKMKKQLILGCLLAFLLAIPLPLAREAAAGVGSYSENDTMVLAKMIHGEARGEPYIGKVAVGAVILNRVEDKRFPNTVYGVCFQPGAFDAVSDGQYYLEPNQSAIDAAKAAINGWDPTYGALYYWNPATATSKWIWSRTIVGRFGKHVFGV